MLACFICPSCCIIWMKQVVAPRLSLGDLIAVHLGNFLVAAPPTTSVTALSEGLKGLLDQHGCYNFPYLDKSKRATKNIHSLT